MNTDEYRDLTYGGRSTSGVTTYDRLTIFLGYSLKFIFSFYTFIHSEISYKEALLPDILLRSALREISVMSRVCWFRLSACLLACESGGGGP